MPREGIRQPAVGAHHGAGAGPSITIQGRILRVRLAGSLDRDGASRLIREVEGQLLRPGALVVLDGSGLQHLDYRCVRLLLDWQRRLRSYRHRLYLAGWNSYLRAILAMEDWGGELSSDSPGWFWRTERGERRHVQVP
jgi:ABC-type transporter Mla MlaB component